MSFTDEDKRRERAESFLMKEYNRNYDNFLRGVAKTFLGREATVDDIADFGLIYDKGTSQTFLEYKGKVIGEIVTNFSDDGITFNFKPSTEP